MKLQHNFVFKCLKLGKVLTFSSLTSFYRYGFITFETSEEADQVRDKVRDCWKWLYLLGALVVATGHWFPRLNEVSDTDADYGETL